VSPLAVAAEALLETCLKNGVTLATAESCTGGLVAAALTAIPGSSRVFERGFVTYANQAKTDMLGVPADLIAGHGAVSASVAQAMAEGALRHSPATASLAITGVAGPDGGSADKPVGTVHIAVARQDRLTLHERYHFAGDRDSVREQAALAAMTLLTRFLNGDRSI
jgi:nicotinamide-nucleotide amidase